jgi:hypothetical protein
VKTQGNREVRGERSGERGQGREVIQYPTPLSQASAGSPTPEHVKRPHDGEEFDAAKRMRLTPDGCGEVRGDIVQRRANGCSVGWVE